MSRIPVRNGYLCHGSLAGKLYSGKHNVVVLSNLLCAKAAIRNWAQVFFGGPKDGEFKIKVIYKKGVYPPPHPRSCQCLYLFFKAIDKLEENETPVVVKWTRKPFAQMDFFNCCL